MVLGVIQAFCFCYGLLLSWIAFVSGPRVLFFCLCGMLLWVIAHWNRDRNCEQIVLLKKLFSVFYISLRIKMWVFCLNSVIWGFCRRGYCRRGCCRWGFCRRGFVMWVFCRYPNYPNPRLIYSLSLSLLLLLLLSLLILLLFPLRSQILNREKEEMF